MTNAELQLFDFIAQLKSKKIAFTLTSVRDDTIMVQVAVPGERWEVEFFKDGTIEVERFSSPGEIAGKAVIDELFQRFGE
jgi:hypothetical protein